LDTHLDIYILCRHDDRHPVQQRRKTRQYTDDSANGSINDNFVTAILFQLTRTKTRYSNFKQGL